MRKATASVLYILGYFVALQLPPQLLRCHLVSKAYLWEDHQLIVFAFGGMKNGG